MLHDSLPSFHDGSFNGVRIVADHEVHLYFSTVENERYVIRVSGVYRMHVWNLREGSIVFDVTILNPSKLTEKDMDALVYRQDNDLRRPEEDAKERARFLAHARSEGLNLLGMSTSYGAEAAVLFKDLAVSQETS